MKTITKTLRPALWLCCLLAALCAFAFAANAQIVESGFCGVVDPEKGLDGSQVSWTLDDEGLLTISGEGAMADYKHDMNASYHEGEKISGSTAPWGVDIRRRALKGELPYDLYKGLTGVIIENGVTYIGACAFEDFGHLQTVTIPDSVTGVGKDAWRNSTGIRELTVGKSIERYSPKDWNIPFDQLETVVITQGAASVCDGAFAACEALSSVTFPESLSAVGSNAFRGCKALTGVTLPDRVTVIGEAAFSGCKALRDVVLPISLTDIGSFAFNSTSLTRVTIQRGVTTIGALAFPYGIVIRCTADSCAMQYVKENEKYNGVTSEELICDGTVHVWDAGVLTVPANCTEMGTLTVTCTGCGAKAKAYTAVNGEHDWNEGVVTREPACARAGVTAFTCRRCGETKTERIAALGHERKTFPEEPATCKTAGMTQSERCARCGVILEGEKIYPLGHTWDKGTITKPVSFSLNAEKTYTCTVCGASKTVTPLVITKQPEDVIYGKRVFSVEVRGPEPSYRWEYSEDGGTTWKTVYYKNRDSMATSAALDLNGVSGHSAAYLYRCRIYNKDETIYSRAARYASEEREHYFIRYHRSDSAAASQETVMTYGTKTSILSMSYLGFDKDGGVFAGWRVQRASDGKWRAFDKNGKYAWAALENGALPEGYTWCLYEDGKGISDPLPEETMPDTLDLYAQWDKEPTGGADDDPVPTEAPQDTVFESDRFKDLQYKVVTSTDEQGTTVYVGEVTGEGYMDNNPDALQWYYRNSVRASNTYGPEDANAAWINYLYRTYPDRYEYLSEHEDFWFVDIPYTGPFWTEKNGDKTSKIIVRDGVCSISNWGLAYARGDVVIEGAVNGIGDYAFYHMQNLHTVVIPVSVKSVGKEAFYGTDLETVYYGGSEEQWNRIERDGPSCDHPYAVVFNADGHVWDDGVTKKAPTCEADGEIVYTCRDCGQTLTAPVRWLNHDWDEGVVTKETVSGRDGERVYTCKRCGETQTVVDPDLTHLHRYSPESIGYTIKNTSKQTAQGEKTLTDCTGTVTVYARCTTCNQTLPGTSAAFDVDYKERTFSQSVITEAVWQDGMWYAVFSDGEEIALPMDRLPAYTGTPCAEGHSGMSEETLMVRPTCLSYGVYVKYCSKCGSVWCRAKSGSSEYHQFDEGVPFNDLGVCCNGEAVLYRCTVCGLPKVLGVADGKAHNVTVTVADRATCRQQSLTKYACSVCGKAWESSGNEAIGNDYHVFRFEGMLRKGGTCNARQTQRYVCIYCGKTDDRRESIPAYGDHEWTFSKNLQTPTGAVGGVAEYECRRCAVSTGYVITKTEEVSAAPGDVDGDGKLSSADARLALRASVGLEPDITAGSAAYNAADADGDGEVTSADARLILRASVGLEDPKTFGKKA